MTARHIAPDGGLCVAIKGGWHAQIRTFGSVSWEGIGSV